MREGEEAETRMTVEEDLVEGRKVEADAHRDMRALSQAEATSCVNSCVYIHQHASRTRMIGHARAHACVVGWSFVVG